MNIKTKVTFYKDDVHIKPGSIIEVDDIEAKALISRNFAESAEDEEQEKGDEEKPEDKGETETDEATRLAGQVGLIPETESSEDAHDDSEKDQLDIPGLVGSVLPVEVSADTENLSDGESDEEEDSEAEEGSEPAEEVKESFPVKPAKKKGK